MNLIAKTASPGPGVSVPTLGSWKFFEFSYVFHVFDFLKFKKLVFFPNNLVLSMELCPFDRKFGFSMSNSIYLTSGEVWNQVKNMFYKVVKFFRFSVKCSGSKTRV